MRIVRPRERGEVALEHPLGIVIHQHHQVLPVSLAHELLGRRRREGRRVCGGGVGRGDFVRRLQRHIRLRHVIGLVGALRPDHQLSEVLVLDALSPQLVPLFLVGGPRHILAPPLVSFIGREIEPLFEQLVHVLDPVAGAFLQHLVNAEGQVGLALAKLVVESRDLGHEGFHVRCQEVTVFVIQRIEVDAQGGFGQIVVQRFAGDVKSRQIPRDETGDLFLLLGGRGAFRLRRPKVHTQSNGQCR
ncbi:MAG: hypothetical protein BWY59_00337 [Verrucomicrobia bacterium ADurb.Bin345]|nr:MAG: hypothetical protein BWY59_00337 [Verrucomicrobia bacterium ADurb.Bin345]